MPQGYVVPQNQILADKEGAIVHEYEVGANATAAKMLPGIGVIYDTADYAVKEAGAEADAVLGVLDVNPNGTGLKTTAYARGDQCRVIEHGKCLVLLLSGGGATSPGVPLTTTTDGKWLIQAVGVIGTQGAPAAYALETINPAASDLFCLAMVTGQREAAPAA
jgi:hypothetical protein